MLAIDVSVIVPVYNGAKWLGQCLSSVLSQDFSGSLEVSIYNDGSNDSTPDIIESFRGSFSECGISYITSEGTSGRPNGGWARNKAIRQSSGRFLCLQDADDVMTPTRIQDQYRVAQDCPMTLIGSCFTRDPLGSTSRYTRWANSLSSTQLYTQAYTSFGPTLIMPTWFMPREIYDKYGPFDEGGKGTPEDLLFFFKLLHGGEKLERVEKPLVIYRYHQHNTTHGIDEGTIWNVRVDALQENVTSKWTHFTIWNAGKQGRRLYRSLRPENRLKVIAFCDVDVKKIEKQFYTYEQSKEVPKPKVPILNFRDAAPPYIICVKWDLTGGEFEKNLESLHLKEGEHYYNFS